MFRYFLPFLLLQPLLFSCGNSIQIQQCVPVNGSKCEQKPENNSNPVVPITPYINSSPSPSPVVVIPSSTPIPPQPDAHLNSPKPGSVTKNTPAKPQLSQKEIKKKEVINSLTQNSYKIGKNIIKFINTPEGLKYQRIHTKSGTITTDVCSIDDYKEMKIKISCPEKRNIREVIVDLNGQLECLIVNFYESNSPHITSKHVMSKIKENSVPV
jgi:hypothetical protein